MGDNVWRDENEWPLARTHYVKYYLNSGGHANTAKGDGYLSTGIPETQGTDNYIYDPKNPVQLATEQTQWDIQKQMTTRETVQKRPDLLVYTGEPLTADMEVTGPIIMTLFASTSAKDTDFTATLVDVYPDGHTQLIQDGIVRMRYLNSDTREELLVPGQIYTITIDMWATSNVFKKGHRIQVEVSSSNFDKFDRNLNTGETFGRSTAMISVKQTIYHSKAYPSHITLPVIPR
jgi:putative CocE/NonD family hydrolase